MIAERSEKARTRPGGRNSVGKAAARERVGGGPDISRLFPAGPPPAIQRWGATGRESSGTETAVRPMGRRRAVTIFGRAKERPMLVAVLVASFCVTLATLHVAAYARVTEQGNEQIRLKKAIADAEIERETLTAHVSELTLPSKIRKSAEDRGLVLTVDSSGTLVDSPSAQSPAAAGNTSTAVPAR